MAPRPPSAVSQPAAMASAGLVSAAEAGLAALALPCCFYTRAGENRLLIALSRVAQASRSVSIFLSKLF